MSYLWLLKNNHWGRRLVCGYMVCAFVLHTLTLPSLAQLSGPLPISGHAYSDVYEPVVLKGLSIHTENPLLVDFVVDRGTTAFPPAILEEESTQLIKYFLTAVTIPDKESWVNLSPTEDHRIIPEALGQTEMGRIMLEQDYVLKMFVSSLTNPQTEVGKKYWDEFNQQDVPTEVDSAVVGKVWIVPDGADVFEMQGFAYITASKLKVMFQGPAGPFQKLILPELEKAVNTSQDFAPIRQVYQSVILAVWYKQALRESLLGKIYVDQSKISGVDTQEVGFKDRIYREYLNAFKNGAYDFIAESFDAMSGEMIPRKYFSGGISHMQSVQIQRAPISTMANDVRQLQPRLSLASSSLRETHKSLFGVPKPTTFKSRLADFFGAASGNIVAEFVGEPLLRGHRYESMMDLYSGFGSRSYNPLTQTTISSMMASDYIRFKLLGAIVDQHTQGVLLTVGSGTGEMERELKDEGLNVVGIDVLPSLVQASRQHGILALVADGNQLPFPDQHFGSIIFPESMEHLDWGQSIQEAHRVLRESGSISIISAIKDPKHHALQIDLDVEAIKGILIQTGFENIQVENFEGPSRYGLVNIIMIQAKRKANPKIKQQTDHTSSAVKIHQFEINNLYFALSRASHVVALLQEGGLTSLRQRLKHAPYSTMPATKDFLTMLETIDQRLLDIKNHQENKDHRDNVADVLNDLSKDSIYEKFSALYDFVIAGFTSRRDFYQNQLAFQVEVVQSALDVLTRDQKTHFLNFIKMSYAFSLTEKELIDKVRTEISFENGQIIDELISYVRNIHQDIINRPDDNSLNASSALFDLVTPGVDDNTRGAIATLTKIMFAEKPFYGSLQVKQFIKVYWHNFLMNRDDLSVNENLKLLLANKDPRVALLAEQILVVRNTFPAIVKTERGFDRFLHELLNYTIVLENPDLMRWDDEGWHDQNLMVRSVVNLLVINRISYQRLNKFIRLYRQEIVAREMAPFEFLTKGEIAGADKVLSELIHEGLANFLDLNREDNIDQVEFVLAQAYSFINIYTNALKVDTSSSSAIDNDVGGIDFNSSKVKLQIKRDGQGVPLPLPQQNLEQIHLEGLSPVILYIQPFQLNTIPVSGHLLDHSFGSPTASPR